MTADRPIRCSRARRNSSPCAFELIASKYGAARFIKGECREHHGELLISMAVIVIQTKALIAGHNGPKKV